MSKQIKDFTAKSTPADNDLFLLQDASNNVYKHCTKAQLLAGSQAASGLSPWKSVSANYTPASGERLIVSTAASAVTLTISSSASFGIEIDIYRLDTTNNLFISGATKVNGVSVLSGGIVLVNQTVLAPTKLIYIGSTYGWVSVPSNGVTVLNPLNLPTTGLQQQFYANAIAGLTDGQSISQWSDTISNNHATQSTANNQPTYKSGIFGVLPGVLFSGSQFLSTNLTHLANNYYTIAIVERRNESGNTLYAFGNDTQASNQGLHVGYRTNTSFTLAQFANDLDYTSVPSYSNQISRIWVVSKQSRGTEIWLNNNLVQSNTNATQLTTCANGTIGRALGNGWFKGHIGLIANWTGAKTQSEIQAIFSAINNTFGID
jgi:hypothetical protein